MPEEKKGTAPFQWNTLRGGPYMPTPIIYRDQLYVLDNSGILSSFSMRDGNRLYRKRIRNEEANAFTASPIIANGYLYAVSEIGVSFIVRLDSEGEVVATKNSANPCWHRQRLVETNYSSVVKNICTPST